MFNTKLIEVTAKNKETNNFEYEIMPTHMEAEQQEELTQPKSKVAVKPAGGHAASEVAYPWCKDSSIQGPFAAS